MLGANAGTPQLDAGPGISRRLGPGARNGVALLLTALLVATMLGQHRHMTVIRSSCAGPVSLGAVADGHLRSQVIDQLYGFSGGSFANLSYLDLLEDERLAPLTKITQRWIYTQQHPNPSTCGNHKYTGRLLVYHDELGKPLVGEGCRRSEPHSNLLCLFEPPFSCGKQHSTKENTEETDKFMTKLGPPPYLVKLLKEHFLTRNVELTPDFVKYWWRAESVAYLARLNDKTRQEVAKLRRRDDMFVPLTPIHPSMPVQQQKIVH